MIMSFNQYLHESGHESSQDKLGSMLSKLPWANWLSGLIHKIGGTVNIDTRESARGMVHIIIKLDRVNISFNTIMVSGYDTESSPGDLFRKGYADMSDLDKKFLHIYSVRAVEALASGKFTSKNRGRFYRAVESAYINGDPEALIRVLHSINQDVAEQGLPLLTDELLPTLMEPFGLSPEEVSDYRVLLDLGLI
jgi:hypothetical protein